MVVPMISQYEHNAEYYSTCFHELTHSTMAESRCNREAEEEMIHQAVFNRRLFV